MQHFHSIIFQDLYIREDLKAVASSGQIDWERFRGKTVAVTGATGLLGKLLVLAFLRADEMYGLNLRVQAFVRDREKAQTRIRAYLVKGKGLLLSKLPY